MGSSLRMSFCHAASELTNRLMLLITLTSGPKEENIYPSYIAQL